MAQLEIFLLLSFLVSRLHLYPSLRKQFRPIVADLLNTHRGYKIGFELVPFMLKDLQY